MKQLKIFFVMLMGVCIATTVWAEEEKDYKQKHAEKITKMEETFFAASKEGKTIKGVLIEGYTFFNGTNDIRSRPYGQPYSHDELRSAKISAERNSPIFILTKDGDLYLPCPKKGEKIVQSIGGVRFPRVLTEEEKAEGLFTWSTLVPMIGRKIEVYGEVYPGHGGVKGLHIEYIAYEGEYLVGED